MLRTYFAQCSRPAASLFHTSAVAPAAVAHPRVLGSLHPEAPRNANKTDRNKDRSARKRKAKPHPVLGHRIGNEALWLNSDLCKALVDEEKLAQAPVESLHVAGDSVTIPKNLAFGVGEQERKVLFEHLPTLSAQSIPEAEGLDGKSKAPTSQPGHGVAWLPNDSDISWMVKQRLASGEPSMSPEDLAAAEARERYKLKAVTQVLDLRNANAAGLAYENRRRCIAAFSSPENPHDPGRPEVQAAILTMRIRKLWVHLNQFRQDKENRKALRILVHQRQKILRYLKNYNRVRYDDVLPRLGLEAESIEGEITI